MTEKETTTEEESMKGLLIALAIIGLGAIAAGVWFYNIIENKTKYNTPDVKELSQEEKDRFEVEKIENQKMVDLNQILVALKMHFDDENNYPKSNNMVPVQDIFSGNLDMYLSETPSNPIDGEEYYYISLNTMSGEDTSCLLAAQMKLNKNCNFPAYNMKELESIIIENENNSDKIKELINNDGEFDKNCFYVIHP